MVQKLLACRWSIQTPQRLRSSAKILVVGPSRLNELLEVRFEFPFNPVGKSTIALLMGQSWRILKSWYTGVGPEQGFQRGFADGLNQSLVSSVAQV